MGLTRMQIESARMMIVLVRGRAAQARREGRSEVGASAIEWAIISAIVVTLALVVYGFVERAINDKADDIQQDP